MEAAAIFITLLLALLTIFLFFLRDQGRKRSSKKLPPGSLGLPLIGQSLQLLRAMRANTAEKWLQDRVKMYGPVSKLSLFGSPTVFLVGPAANKFLFTSDSETLSNEQIRSIHMILGDRNLLTLRGDDHRRVRAALMSFLKPEVLKDYVGKMDEEVKKHIDTYWKEQQELKAMPLMKTLTFDIISSLLFGLERGPRRRNMISAFREMMMGMWAVPMNLPFTRFNRSLRASRRLRTMATQLIHEKRQALEEGRASPHDDLVTCLLDIRNEDNEGLISEEEIRDNVALVMVAGHDTSAVVLTFFIRLLATNPDIRANVLQEQEEVTRCKDPEKPLTWEDLSKMKYTWKTATEILRVIPPVFGGFRRALKDLEFDGYTIPKDWQIFWASASTHLDETIFAEPWKIDPSRFDGQTPVTPYSFVAFGGGPRICPGNEFARLEILVTVHYLVTQFDWKLCCKDDTYRRDPMPTPNQELPIQLKPRGSVSQASIV
ncbi:cytochrome P450 716B1-like [Aristolochia californica]|uniref:cytochrome P450 716B1-like n=1 Tax=Aristolochia californica TaxID=171875 RepID=UPI0035D68F12